MNGHFFIGKGKNKEENMDGQEQKGKKVQIMQWTVPTNRKGTMNIV